MTKQWLFSFLLSASVLIFSKPEWKQTSEYRIVEGGGEGSEEQYMFSVLQLILDLCAVTGIVALLIYSLEYFE